MEPSIVEWVALANPTAAFASFSNTMDSLQEKVEIDTVDQGNIIETPPNPHRYEWQVDGCNPDGTQIFAFPNFARGEQVRRIHVVVPDSRSIPQKLRIKLGWDKLLGTGTSGFPKLPMAAHLLQALEIWSTSQHDFESEYRSVPFGSYIAIEYLCENPENTRLQLVPSYETEREWLTLSRLKQVWTFSDDDFPPTISISVLQFQVQIHEYISLVRISQSPELGCVVFKTVDRDTKFMYHEMKVLIAMSPHPNVMSKPLFLVTKQCGFGGKVGVCGFILPYYAHGTLQKTILDADKYNKLDTLACARDLVSALVHVNQESPGFHPELRPDNVAMSDSSRFAPVLIDFEQRGTQFAWGPPEIVYISYLIWLATHLDDSKARSRYEKLLSAHGISTESVRSEKYSGSSQGYNVSWLLLSSSQREQAQIFLLGKLLWCLFERRAGVSNGLAFDTLRRDLNGDHAFPEFRHTPEKMRNIIRRCTIGAPEWQGRCVNIACRNGKLYTKMMKPMTSGSGDETRIVFQSIKQWWKDEISLAEGHINSRTQGRLPIDHPHAILMKERGTLEQLQSELCSE